MRSRLKGFLHPHILSRVQVVPRRWGLGTHQPESSYKFVQNERCAINMVFVRPWVNELTGSWYPACTVESFNFSASHPPTAQRNMVV